MSLSDLLSSTQLAVQSGLRHMGYENVEQVRIGKYIELRLSAADEQKRGATGADVQCWQIR